MRTLLMLLLAFIVITSFSSTKLMVTSPGFKNDGMMPAKYSCEGDEVSPPLHIADIPANAKSLAIIMHDPDAPMQGGFTHWVVWNIAPGSDISENFKGAVQGMNDSGQSGYKGMCPPSGTHHYHITVYALDRMLDIDKKTDMKGLEKAMQEHIVAQGELVGLYTKTKSK